MTAPAKSNAAPALATQSAALACAAELDALAAALFQSGGDGSARVEARESAVGALTERDAAFSGEEFAQQRRTLVYAFRQWRRSVLHCHAVRASAEELLRERLLTGALRVSSRLGHFCWRRDQACRRRAFLRWSCAARTRAKHRLLLCRAANARARRRLSAAFSRWLSATRGMRNVAVAFARCVALFSACFSSRGWTLAGVIADGSPLARKLFLGAARSTPEGAADALAASALRERSIALRQQLAALGVHADAAPGDALPGADHRLECMSSDQAAGTEMSRLSALVDDANAALAVKNAALAVAEASARASQEEAASLRAELADGQSMLRESSMLLERLQQAERIHVADVARLTGELQTSQHSLQAALAERDALKAAPPELHTAELRAAAAEARAAELARLLQEAAEQAEAQHAQLLASEAAQRTALELDFQRVCQELARARAPPVERCASPVVLGDGEPSTFRAKAAARVAALRAQLEMHVATPPAASATAAVNFVTSSPAATTPASSGAGVADIRALVEEALASAPAVEEIRGQLSRLLHTLGDAPRIAAAAEASSGAARADEGAPAAVAEAAGVRAASPTVAASRAASPLAIASRKRMDKGEPQPTVIIRVTEVTDEVKRLRSELALAQATLEAVARGAAQESRLPDAGDESAEHTNLLAAISTLQAKLLSTEEALRAAQSDANGLRAQQEESRRTLSSLEFARQNAAEEAAQVWDMLRETQATLAARDAAQEAAEAARDAASAQAEQTFAALSAAREERTQLQSALDDAHAATRELHGQLNASVARCGELEEALHIMEKRSDSLEEQLRMLTADIAAARSDAHRHCDANSSLKAALAVAQAAAAAASKQLACAVDEVATLKHANLRLEQAADAAAAAEAVRADIIERLQQQLHVSDVALADARSREEDASAERRRLVSARDNANARAAALQTSLTANEELLAAARMHVSSEEARSQAAAAELESSRMSAALLRREKEELEAALARVGEQADGAAEGLRASAARESALLLELQAANAALTAARLQGADACRQAELEAQQKGDALAALYTLQATLSDAHGALMPSGDVAVSVCAAAMLDAVAADGNALLLQLTELDDALATARALAERSLAGQERLEAELESARSDAFSLRAALSACEAQLAEASDAFATELQAATREHASAVAHLAAVAKEQYGLLQDDAETYHIALEEACAREHALEEELSALKAELGRVRSDAAMAEAKQHACAEETVACAARADALLQRATELQSQLEASHAAAEHALHAQSAVSAELDGALARAATLEAAAAASASQLDAAQQSAAVLEAELARARASLVDIEVARDMSAAEAASSMKRAAELESQLQSSEVAAAEALSAASALMAERDAALARVSTLCDDSAALEARNSELQHSMSSLDAELSRVRAQLADSEAALQATSSERVSASARADELLQRAAELESQLQSSEAAAAAALRAASALTAERDAAVEHATALTSAAAAPATVASEALKAELESTVAHCSLLAKELSDISAARASAVVLTERLQIELEQARSSVDESSDVLALLQQDKHALELRVELQEQQLGMLRSSSETQAEQARRYAAAVEQAATLRADLQRQASARESSEERARAAAESLADALAEVTHVREELQKLETQTAVLATAAAAMRRDAVLSHLAPGDEQICHTGVLWFRPHGGIGAAAWARCGATLTRAGVLQLYDGPPTSADLRLRIDIADCCSVTTSRVDSYRTLTLARGQTMALCVHARSTVDPAASAVVLVACGRQDADTRIWAELLRLFLPAGGVSAALAPDDARTPRAAKS